MNKKEIKEFEDNFTKNFMNTGLIFMHTLWVENKLSKLLILKKNPELIEDFNKTGEEEYLSEEYIEQRNLYWEDYFGKIKEEFIKNFDLSEEDIININFCHRVRNAIGHSIVSGNKEGIFYLPRGNQETKEDIKKAFEVKEPNEVLEPMILILEFHKKEKYDRAMEKIINLNSKLDNISKSLRINVNKMQ